MCIRDRVYVAPHVCVVVSMFELLCVGLAAPFAASAGNGWSVDRDRVLPQPFFGLRGIKVDIS